MSILDILEFPDPRLRTTAKEVISVTAEIQTLVEDMLETMYAAPGIGLAATQVNVHQRVIVIDISEENNEPLVFINPTYEVLDTEEGEYDEGCLSVPGFYETVVRPQHIKINALNKQGEAFEIEAKGLLAICLQHEVDHLNGKLFVDYISPLKRQRIRKKLEKAHKEQVNS